MAAAAAEAAAAEAAAAASEKRGFLEGHCLVCEIKRKIPLSRENSSHIIRTPLSPPRILHRKGGPGDSVLGL